MMLEATHLSLDEIEAGLDVIRQSPKDGGVLAMIVRRPAVGEREILKEGILDVDDGLVGDTWRERSSSRTADGSPHPDMQLTLMNTRMIDLIAQSQDRWPLAGDQLFVDMDLSKENLPVGMRLALGASVLEVTDQPHTGCAKFMARYGKDALRMVSSPVGIELQLRGIYTKVVQPGVIRVGDALTKL